MITKNTHRESGQITEFVALIAKGIECWTKAGEIVVRLVDESGMTIETIADQSNYLTEDIVAKFEQMGRKQLVPELLVLDYPATRHIAKLPYSEQRRLLDGTVELMVLTEKGSDTLRVATENLTSAQCRQVFDGNTVRTVAAQRAWLQDRQQEERMRAAIVDQAQLPWRIKGRRVVFAHACEMSARELAHILSQME